jgi:hypothetical protein
MKMFKSVVVLTVLFFGISFVSEAQIVQYVDLSSGQQANEGAYLRIQPNQLLSVVGGAGTVTGYDTNGNTFSLSIGNGVFCGMTNINLPPKGTFPIIPQSIILQITTPASANVVSNYVPADAIVIPASATGNVQIILESSPDLVNWTAGFETPDPTAPVHPNSKRSHGQIHCLHPLIGANRHGQIAVIT